MSKTGRIAITIAAVIIAAIGAIGVTLGIWGGLFLTGGILFMETLGAEIDYDQVSGEFGRLVVWGGLGSLMLLSGALAIVRIWAR
ncbi:hypothetical protein [Maricaulis sp.]|uniref:hypothetical protein n=1 Tax=Maricaulis sp. TaxID=1486257 RepID=UPI001B04E596|nr:hypothetical protein [Maricaulis sp.]MBO6797350.1 hypothetical protein [Maricaulis sp.]